MTLVLLAAVAGITAIIILGKGQQEAQRQSNDPAPVTGMLPGGEQAVPPAKEEAKPADPAPAPAPQLGAGAPVLSARAPGSPVKTPSKLGSIDPAKARFELVFSAGGAGLERIDFSEYWHNAAQARTAREYWKANAGGAGPELPAGSRYSIVPAGTLQGFAVPLLAARVLEVDGQSVNLFGSVWAEREPGHFVTEIADSTGALQMRVTRRWSIQPGSFDIALEQRVENLGTTAHTVRWVQFAPGDLLRDPGELVDTRRFQSGYLLSPERDQQQRTVIAHGAMLEHSTILKQVAANDFVIWPNAHQAQEKYGLSWFGATNRYFSLAVHAPYAPPQVDSKLAAPAVATIQAQQGELAADGTVQPAIFTESTSAPVTIAPGKTASFDLGVFAGPLDRMLLTGTEPFSALNMQGLIMYLMGGCCSFCTFSWLADGLVWFLWFLANHVVFDWGLAIVVLVVVVRLILHPLTRRAQISMQMMTRKMAAIKPEMEAIQKRYKDDKAKLQEETIRLYREHGVNPLGCAGGLLPTFLQMPIWIALYAVLYFAFELRQQPAFFGVFQGFGGWGFLADLSAQDHFLTLPFEINLYLIKLSSINLIPVLMGVVFFVQQKYMAPPPSPNMTPEQQTQQTMMKWMMVILFPFMLYNAPSGLTLYIATSTLVGIFESKRIKAEVDKMDFSKPQATKPGWIAQRLSAAMQRAQQAQGGGNGNGGGGGQPRRFKGR
ncbi:MAG: YidC/Oxa1 family insertase periplasmic-domain containing protein [Phycisphaerales bacterium]